MRLLVLLCLCLLCAPGLRATELRLTNKLALIGGDYERGRDLCRVRPSETLTITSGVGVKRQISLGRAKTEVATSGSEDPTVYASDLKPGELKDLLTYLRTSPPSRKASDLASIRQAQTMLASQENPDRHLQIVLVASKQDHPEGQHDYPAWQQRWSNLLSRAKDVKLSVAQDWPSSLQFSNANAIVFYFWNHQWTPERYAQLDAYLAAGGGIAFFHAAVIADKEPEKLAERIGLAAQPGPTKYLHTSLTLKFSVPAHPVTEGFSKLELLDEPYWPMIGDRTKVRVLASTPIEGDEYPQVWTVEQSRGRVFCSIIGHYTWTWTDPLFQVLALRGVAWAARERTTRFDTLGF